MELETLNKIVTSIHKDIAHIVNRFNRDRMDGSDGWVAFTKEFDESTKRLETTLDSGEGTTVVLLFDDIWLNSDGDVTYKFVIDHIDANNAQMNIVNMRRHGFDDYKAGPRIHNIYDERKYYQHWRFFSKVLSDNDSRYTNVGERSGLWLNAFRSVMRVGQRRQEKTGVAAHERVAQSNFKQNLSECIAAIQLVDTGMERINAQVAEVRDWFKEIKVDYKSNDTKLYENPYTKGANVIMPVEVSFYTDVNKFKSKKDPLDCGDRYYLFQCTYHVRFDVVTNDCDVDDTKWQTRYAYYFSDPEMKIPDALGNSVTITAHLDKGVMNTGDDFCTGEQAMNALSIAIKNMLNAQKLHDAMMAGYAAQK